MAYNLAEHALERDDKVLICEEHHLVVEFNAGTLWREVYKKQAQHMAECHAGDTNE